MKFRNSSHSFGIVTQTLHWIVALLILALFALGMLMNNLSFETQAQIERAFFIFSLHKTVGMSVFVLAVVRIIWAFSQPHPHALRSHQPIEVLGAQVVHWLLYATIFAMPLTGWLHHSATQALAPIWGPFPQRLGLVPQTETAEAFWGWAHYVTAWIMGGIVAMHIGGALKHLVIDKDGTLQRMLPWANINEETVSEPSFKTLAPLLAAVAALAAAVAVYVTAPSNEHESSSSVEVSSEISGNWIVISEESKLGISVIQNGSPVEGHFKTWSAEIEYDSTAPGAARVKVDIDITSLELGSVSQNALAPDYLNASAFPHAQFQSTGFTNVGENQFETEGMLNLAGFERPLTLHFMLVLDGNAASADGSATVARLDHKIGPQEAGTVGHDVALTFALKASRK